MRKFDYTGIPQELMCPQIMNLVAAIHEYKGKQEQYEVAKPDILTALLDVARIQSTGASNRIEGIVTTEKRLEELVRDRAEPRSRAEHEIAGYREVLATIHENYAYMAPRANVVLQLHRDLYQYGAASYGGNYKNADNQIAEVDPLGRRTVRFRPLSAFETPAAIERLTDEFIDAVNRGEIDPLLLIPMFILDFLCIHPFNDGNGRMSRLLTLLTLYRSGYVVGKYISIEMIIEQTKETYYDVLGLSSKGWHEGENDCLPFVRYYLEVILKAYKEFSRRVEHLEDRKVSKNERICMLFEGSLKKLSKKDIRALCPDISESTIELVLSQMLKDGHILKDGAGRNTRYIRNMR